MRGYSIKLLSEFTDPEDGEIYQVRTNRYTVLLGDKHVLVNWEGSAVQYENIPFLVDHVEKCVKDELFEKSGFTRADVRIEIVKSVFNLSKENA